LNPVTVCLLCLSTLLKLNVDTPPLFSGSVRVCIISFYRSEICTVSDPSLSNYAYMSWYVKQPDHV
jgi:hypothetical protein